MSENRADLTVILADGDPPRTTEPIRILRSAERIVCCDGAAALLAEYGLEPTVVIGDLDSLPQQWKDLYADRLVHVREQETNDLSKAFRYCMAHDWRNIVILGATGKREELITRNRTDVYGTGFVKFADKYPLAIDKDAAGETPFNNKEKPL